MTFTKDQDRFLSDHYNPGIRVDPACLAMTLGLRGTFATGIVERRLRELGLRKAAYPESKRK